MEFEGFAVMIHFTLGTVPLFLSVELVERISMAQSMAPVFPGSSNVLLTLGA